MTDPARVAATLAAALAAPVDLTDGTWERVPATEPRPKIVISTRIPPDISERLMTEAARVDTRPTTLAAELIAEALDARAAAAGQPTRRMIDVDAVHRAIDGLTAAA